MQGLRLMLAAELTRRARDAEDLAAIAAPVERAHRVRFEPPYPGEEAAGVLACRALDADGTVVGVVLTTLVEGRAPAVSVGPPVTRVV
jgi:hypothetical protein